MEKHIKNTCKKQAEFEMLSGGLSGAVNGFWQVADADQGQGVAYFKSKGNLWKQRGAKSKDLWAD